MWHCYSIVKRTKYFWQRYQFFLLRIHHILPQVNIGINVLYCNSSVENNVLIYSYLINFRLRWLSANICLHLEQAPLRGVIGRQPMVIEEVILGAKITADILMGNWNSDSWTLAEKTLQKLHILKARSGYLQYLFNWDLTLNSDLYIYIYIMIEDIKILYK